jgi:hypothetical protein
MLSRLRKPLAFAVMALVICAASAQAQAPAQEFKGTVTYETLKVGGDAPDPNYYIGDDVCTGGNEHYGPKCVKNPHIPSEVIKASLKLADGRVIDVAKTKVASAAWGEAIMRKDHKGAWDVTYKVVGQHDLVYPFAQVKQHHIEDIEVTFPATTGGKIHYVVNVITVDETEQYLHAVDYAR